MGVVDAIEWACVLGSCHIQKDCVSRTMNLFRILHRAWTFLRRNYLVDLEGHSYGQLVTGSFILTTCPFMHHGSCRGFWKTSNHSGDSASLQSYKLGALQYPFFSPNKIAFVREEISGCWWDSGKCNGTADGYWENSVTSQGATLKGTKESLSYCPV